MEVFFLVIGLVFCVFLIGAGIAGLSGGTGARQQGTVETFEQTAREALKDEPDFTPEYVRAAWPSHLGAQPKSVIVLDRTRGRLYLLGEVRGDWVQIRVEPENILGIELIEDQRTVGEVSRVRQLGGAVAGAALAGPAGAVIGGLSSGQASSSQVERIDLLLNLTFPDQKDFPPIHFSFWHHGNGWSRLSPDGMRQMRGAARKWFTLLQEMLEAGTRGSDGAKPGSFCSQCGVKLGQDARFCGSCGAGVP